MSGEDDKVLNKLTWEEYTDWQGWDEWPELSEAPPLTVETPFWYKGKEYMVTSLRYEYVIVTMPEFEEVICNKNFLALLNMPFMDGKSFKELMDEFLFEG